MAERGCSSTAAPDGRALAFFTACGTGQPPGIGRTRRAASRCVTLFSVRTLADPLDSTCGHKQLRPGEPQPARMMLGEEVEVLAWVRDE